LKDSDKQVTIEMAVQEWYSYGRYFDASSMTFTQGFTFEAQMYV